MAGQERLHSRDHGNLQRDPGAVSADVGRQKYHKQQSSLANTHGRRERMETYNPGREQTRWLGWLTHVSQHPAVAPVSHGRHVRHPGERNNHGDHELQARRETETRFLRQILLRRDFVYRTTGPRDHLQGLLFGLQELLQTLDTQVRAFTRHRYHYTHFTVLLPFWLYLLSGLFTLTYEKIFSITNFTIILFRF